MLQMLIPMITAILGQSHNDGARKAASLVNSAASFISKNKPKDKNKDPI